jgi:hypothetical protein
VELLLAEVLQEEAEIVVGDGTVGVAGKDVVAHKKVLMVAGGDHAVPLSASGSGTGARLAERLAVEDSCSGKENNQQSFLLLK